MNAKYGNIMTKILTVLLVIAMFLVARESVQFVSAIEETDKRAFQKDGEEITIVVDAGHGGIDPGKIGINNALEKDINLAIALKLERNLRENGINVAFIRTAILIPRSAACRCFIIKTLSRAGKRRRLCRRS